MNHSPWINHVKQFSKQHNMTYKESLQHPQCRESYHNGGSIKSNFIGKMIATKQFDINKIKNPSPNLINKYKQIDKPVKKLDFDETAINFQSLVFKTPINQIKKILVEMQYKGKMHLNKILLVQQLSQNFGIDKMLEFIKLVHTL